MELQELNIRDDRLRLDSREDIVAFCHAVMNHERLYRSFFSGKPCFEAPTLFQGNLHHVFINLKMINNNTNRQLAAALRLTRLTAVDVKLNEDDFQYIMEWDKMPSVCSLYFECSWVVRASL